MKLRTDHSKKRWQEAGGEPKWLRQFEIAGLQMLLARYDIPPEHPDRYFYLSLALANRYVKNFPVPRLGRPRKVTRHPQNLADLSGANATKKVAVSGRKWADEDYKMVIRIHDAGHAHLRATSKSIGKIRIIDALASGIRLNAPSMSRDGRDALTKKLSSRYAEAKKALRK